MNTKEQTESRLKNPKEKINDFLSKTGHDQRWLSRRCGVTDGFISQLLNGKSTSRAIKRTIARLLRIPYEDLWGNGKI